MSELSAGHHCRHLKTEEERDQFARTAPIKTRFYWDLANELAQTNPRETVIMATHGGILDSISARALPGKDDAELHASRRVMERVIQAAIE